MNDVTIMHAVALTTDEITTKRKRKISEEKTCIYTYTPTTDGSRFQTRYYCFLKKLNFHSKKQTRIFEDI